MTSHYYHYSKGVLHYYEMGLGKDYILCFHGFGMHGKQFKDLEESVGKKFTLISFDLFFHKETRLFDQSLKAIHRGISKEEFSNLILDFCHYRGIDRFSVLGYSMGTHYATALTEKIPYLINHYIVAAPASLRPTVLVRFLSTTILGNRLLKWIVLSRVALPFLLKSLRALGIIEHKTFTILNDEIRTPELRRDLYANFIYLRFLDTDDFILQRVINRYKIRTYFYFGFYDRNYPAKIGSSFFRKIKPTQIIHLPMGHDLINSDFGISLSQVLS